MSLGREDGIAPVIGVGIAFVAKIDPRVGILIGEQSRAAQISAAGIRRQRSSAPRLPRFGGDRMRRGPDGEQVEDHVFAVIVPARFQKTGFRRPAHRKCPAIVQHPRPVDAFIKFRGQPGGFRVGIIFARGQLTPAIKRAVSSDETSEPQRRAPVRRSTEMIKKAVLVRQIDREENGAWSRPGRRPLHG